jgi:peptide/nickel transport system substrate-binding protein
MISTPKRFAGLAAAVLAAATVAACSSSSTSAPAAGGSSSAGTPVSGGTLHIISASGPAHLDTVPSYYTADYQITHTYARQLLQYPTLPYSSTSDANWVKDTTPVADMATDVPSVANGGITDGGKVYTFHIKQGVDWNTTPPRQVTADDFIREFKAFFNPVSPVGAFDLLEKNAVSALAYAVSPAIVDSK